MQQQLAQLFGLIDPVADVVQVHGKGQDEADLGQLSGLEGKAAQLVPGIVVGVAGIVADGEGPQGQVVDHQGGQNQPPGEDHMEWPDLDQLPVVDGGQQQRRRNPQDRGRRLDQGPAEIADAGDLAGDLIHCKAAALFRRPGGQHQHRHGAAEQTEKQIDLVGPFGIQSNAFEHKSTTFHTGSCGVQASAPRPGPAAFAGQKK